VITAALTHDEEARIDLLHALNLLDSEPEDVFDRITRLAARLLDMPIALVSLIDRDRQWFKSRVGLDAHETPRELAFCAHAIHSKQPLVVNDTSLDIRFADNPLVLGAPHIRFYAGAPIFSNQGIALGTLCIIDRKPRSMSAADLEALQDLAELARREIVHRETTQLSREIYQHSDRLNAESEARFRATFEQAAVGIAIVGTDGRWTSVNNKLCTIVGYSEEELLKLTFQDITHPDDLDADMSLVNQMLAGELEHYNLEKRYVRKNGELIWINLSVSLLRDCAGKPLHFISVVEDIQGRKEAENALRRLRQNLEERVQQRTQELQQTNEMLSLTMEQQRRFEIALSARESQLRAVLENAQDAYVSIDEAGLIIQWNRQAELTFGWPRDEAIGRRLDETIIPAQHREGHRQGMKRFLETGEGAVINKRLELSAIRRDGSIFPVEVRISPLPSETGLLFCAFLHDISERKQAEEALRNSQKQLSMITDNLPVHISYIDRDLVIQFLNETYRADVGLTADFAIGKTLPEILNRSLYQDIQPHIEKVFTGERVTFETTTNFHQQERTWSTDYTPDVQNGNMVGFYIMSQDITARKKLELSLEREATLDALTGLPNRRALLECLNEATARAQRSNEPFGLLFLDLDGFKGINDRHGHDGGDEVLKQFANCLTCCVRETDTVARLAGDEFVIVLETLKKGESDAQKVGEKILQALRVPMMVNGKKCAIGASIGIYTWEPTHAMSAEHMIAEADQAMYYAKRGGKNQMYLAKAI